MATHLSMLAWKIPWTDKPDQLQSMGSQRVRLDLVIGFHFHTVSMGVIFIGSHFPIFIQESTAHVHCPISLSSLWGLKRYFMNSLSSECVVMEAENYILRKPF